MQLDGSRILVSGGCGLIGSTTVDLLLREHAPQEIILFDNLSRGTLKNIEQALQDSRVKFVQGDIRDTVSLRKAMEGVDALFHFAAIRITACAATPREAMEVMCDGTFNIVESAQQAGVQKVVAASSASIYGLAEIFPTPESHHPYNDLTWYGASKMMLEGLLRSFHDMYGLKSIALRYFNVYGPRMDIYGKYTEVLVKWLDCIDAGQAPTIFGNGKQTIDLVHVEDIARANLAAMLSDIDHGVYNVGAGKEISFFDLLEALLLLTGRSDTLQPVFMQERSVNPVQRRLADVRAAQRDLGFLAGIEMHDGLQSLIDWRKQQQQDSL